MRKKTAMSRPGKRATSFEDLPEEMAFYIFVRVPVKTLIRSSAVSKRWYSLVKHPDFVSAQISHSRSCSDKHGVLIIPTRHDKYCTLISAENGFVYDKYEIPFTNISHGLRLVGSVNGLICLTDDRRSRSYGSEFGGGFGGVFLDVFRKPVYPNLYLWNPCVRKYKCVDSSCFRKRYVNDVRIWYAVGFGFCEGSGDYRVVRIMYCDDFRGNQFGGFTPRVEVFSLQMNKWRPWRENKSIVVPKVYSKFGTTVGSRVYWVKEKNLESKGLWILSFDFNNEVFGQIKLPDDVCYSLGEAVDFQLMKFEGSLCVCVRKMLHQPLYIWLISHEDGIVSSTIRFKIALEKVGQPLNITKGGALLLASLSPRSTINVLSCNLKSVHNDEYLEVYKSIGNIKPPNVDTFFTESLGGDELLTSAK